MINPSQFSGLILEPALRACGMHSMDAMYLMMCTALVESKLTHIQQLPHGAALGFMQVEWPTYLDCVRYLNLKPQLALKILKYCERDTFPVNPSTLIADLNLNVLIARVKYWMIPAPIPSYKDPGRQAAYYETYFNVNKEYDKTLEFMLQSKYVAGWITHP